jgi:hypothetical protein
VAGFTAAGLLGVLGVLGDWPGRVEVAARRRSGRKTAAGFTKFVLHGKFINLTI